MLGETKPENFRLKLKDKLAELCNTSSLSHSEENMLCLIPAFVFLLSLINLTCGMLDVHMIKSKMETLRGILRHYHFDSIYLN